MRSQIAASRNCFNKMTNPFVPPSSFTSQICALYRQPFYLNPFFNINQILSFDIIFLHSLTTFVNIRCLFFTVHSPTFALT